MSWKQGTPEAPRKPYHAIKCLTCGQVLPSRSYVKAHRNHDVRYVDKNGEIDE